MHQIFISQSVKSSTGKYYIFVTYNFYLLVYKSIMNQTPKCIKNNEANIMCWTQNCKINPIICKDDNCQCLRSHNKCFINIAAKTFFNHLKQLNKQVFDTDKLKKIMIDNLQKFRKQVNVMIDAQKQNIDGHLKNYESQECLKFKMLMEGNDTWTSQKIEYYLKLKQIKLKFTNSYIQLWREKLKQDFNSIKENLKIQIEKVWEPKQYTFDYKPEFKGTDIHLKSFTNHLIQFQYKANGNGHQDLILPKALTKTTKLFIHATNLIIRDNKPEWLSVGIINKTTINFNTGNYSSSIAVSTQEQLYGNMKKIQGNVIQQKNECLYELEYNKQSNYFQIKIGTNKYRLDNLPTSEYYIIIGMYIANSMVRIYER